MDIDVEQTQPPASEDAQALLESIGVEVIHVASATLRGDALYVADAGAVFVREGLSSEREEEALRRELAAALEAHLT